MLYETTEEGSHPGVRIYARTYTNHKHTERVVGLEAIAGGLPALGPRRCKKNKP